MKLWVLGALRSKLKYQHRVRSNVGWVQGIRYVPSLRHLNQRLRILFKLDLDLDRATGFLFKLKPQIGLGYHPFFN